MLEGRHCFACRLHISTHHLDDCNRVNECEAHKHKRMCQCNVNSFQRCWQHPRCIAKSITGQRIGDSNGCLFFCSDHRNATCMAANYRGCHSHVKGDTCGMDLCSLANNLYCQEGPHLAWFAACGPEPLPSCAHGRWRRGLPWTPAAAPPRLSACSRETPAWPCTQGSGMCALGVGSWHWFSRLES